MTEDASRLALAALLIRVAKSDGHFDASEAAQIDAILTARYDVTGQALADLRGQAEQLEKEAPDTVRFTKAIKETVPIEARISIIEALWSVSLADGVRDEEEDALLRMVAGFLGVPDKDSALARQKAQKKLG